jgi:hypothetical protein
MTKVLALLTLAVLTFSAMTGPAFAQIGRIIVRPPGPVEHNFRMTPEHRLPPVVDRELGRAFGWESKRDLDLQPSRPPGSLDNGGSNRF